jgi:hypothetical protein
MWMHQLSCGASERITSEIYSPSQRVFACGNTCLCFALANALVSTKASAYSVVEARKIAAQIFSCVPEGSIGQVLDPDDLLKWLSAELKDELCKQNIIFTSSEALESYFLHNGQEFPVACSSDLRDLELQRQKVRNIQSSGKGAIVALVSGTGNHFVCLDIDRSRIGSEIICRDSFHPESCDSEPGVEVKAFLQNFFKLGLSNASEVVAPTSEVVNPAAVLGDLRPNGFVDPAAASGDSQSGVASTNNVATFKNISVVGIVIFVGCLAYNFFFKNKNKKIAQKRACSHHNHGLPNACLMAS